MKCRSAMAFFDMYSSKKVYIDGDPYIEKVDRRVDDRLSVEDNRALLLFHELAHLTGALGDDRTTRN